MTTHRLLPVYKNANTKPSTAFDLLLDKEAQKLLLGSNRKVKVVVKNGEMLLAIGGKGYKLDNGELTKAKKTVYKQFSSSTFKNIGDVRQSLTIDSTSSSALLIHSDNTTKETVSPLPTTTQLSTQPHYMNGQMQSPSPQIDISKNQVARRLIYLLAMGPITIDDLVARTKAQLADINKVIDTIGMDYKEAQRLKIIDKYPNSKRKKMLGQASNEKRYVLDYNFYKDLKFFESKMYKDDTKRLLRDQCAKIYDYLKYPRNHPARDYLLKSNLDLSSNGSSSAAKESLLQPSPSRVSPEEDSKSKKKTTKQELKPLDSPTTLPMPTGPKAALDGKKRKREEDEEFYKQLAKKFKKKYREYESLYDSLKKNQSSNKEEVKRLVQLHKDLESWKKQLWSSVSKA